MVVGCWVVEERGEGDLGGEEGASGASTGGSSTTVVLCEGVWLLDETCVTVGDTATIQSVPAHRTERIIPARSYWATTTALAAQSNTVIETLRDLRGGEVACARGEAECWLLLIMLLSP